LWLPRAAESGRRMSTDVTEPDPTLHGRATILLVDDDDQVRVVMATMLRDRGYEIIEAANLRTAMVQAEAVDPLDLVVTDVTMAGGDGVALARRLRKRRPSLSILFVSGHMYREGLEGEIVLAKPFPPGKLLEQVLICLGRLPAAPRNDRLLPRLRSSDLQRAYLLWQQLREGVGFLRWLPRLDDFDLSALPGAEHSYLMAVEGGPDRPVFRFVQVGVALASRLGRDLLEHAAEPADEAEPAFSGISEAWARCARTGSPHYDYARYNLDESGDPVGFERLLLPVASDGGRTATHLIGIVAFSGPV